MSHIQPNTELPKTPIIRRYIANISQTGTAAPTAQILHNTIGNIIWQRDALGAYTAILPKTYDINKITAPPNGGVSNNTYSKIMNDGYYQIYPSGSNNLTLLCYSTDGSTLKELSSFGVNTIYIEINIHD